MWRQMCSETIINGVGNRTTVLSCWRTCKCAMRKVRASRAPSHMSPIRHDHTKSIRVDTMMLVTARGRQPHTIHPRTIRRIVYLNHYIRRCDTDILTLVRWLCPCVTESTRVHVDVQCKQAAVGPVDIVCPKGSWALSLQSITCEA